MQKHRDDNNARKRLASGSDSRATISRAVWQEASYSCLPNGDVRNKTSYASLPSRQSFHSAIALQCQCSPARCQTFILYNPTKVRRTGGKLESTESIATEATKQYWKSIENNDIYGHSRLPAKRWDGWSTPNILTSVRDRVSMGTVKRV